MSSTSKPFPKKSSALRERKVGPKSYEAVPDDFPPFPIPPKTKAPSASVLEALRSLRKEVPSDSKAMVAGSPSSPDYKSYTMTRELLRNTFRAFPPYLTALSTTLTLNTSGVGVLNTTVSNTSVAGLTEFTSFAAIFDEFFIKSFELVFIPHNYRLAPVGTTSGTNLCNCPIAVVSLQHATPTYSTMSSALEHETARAVSSGERWNHRWVNSEKPSVVISPQTSTATASQNWCLTSGSTAAAYTGQVQMIATDALGTGGTVVAIGRVMVRWVVKFRIRA
jgi:hypothetical protein